MRQIVPLLFVAALAGCFDRVYVPPSELGQLNGYDIHNERHELIVGYRHLYSTIATDRPYRLVSPDGHVVDFNSQTQLFLHLKDGQIVGGRYVAIGVDDATFRAQLLDRELELPRQDIVAVETKTYSPQRTSWLVAGVAGGVALTAGISVLAALLATRPHPSTQPVP